MTLVDYDPVLDRGKPKLQTALPTRVSSSSASIVLGPSVKLPTIILRKPPKKLIQGLHLAGIVPYIFCGIEISRHNTKAQTNSKHPRKPVK